MSKIAFLFPGQGAQFAGMGLALANAFPAAKAVFDAADEALAFAISKLCFEGPEDQLKLTENTQPAILTVSTAVCRVLKEQGIVPQYVAGHSLGEYSAHVAAGTMAFADAVRTVRKRGQYMQEAVPEGVGAMAAILGLPLDQVLQICSEAAQGEVVAPANMNSPDQIVISGAKGAVERAAELAKQRGAKRALLLAVSAPFHCAMMQPAQDRLAADLNRLAMNDPAVPVIANFDAEPRTTAQSAREALVRQVTGAVEWSRSMQKLIALGVTNYVEAGPGKVLCGLMRQIDRNQNCVNVGDEGTLQKALAVFSEVSAN
jgi:[acyl-carrier-protein] S-malonyltransferase